MAKTIGVLGGITLLGVLLALGHGVAQTRMQSAPITRPSVRTLARLSNCVRRAWLHQPAWEGNPRLRC